MQPSAYITNVALKQLDLYASEGVHRVLAGFSSLGEDAEVLQQRVLESYVEAVGEQRAVEFVGDARDFALSYYRFLQGLKGGIVNLLAVGLYHLYEQHSGQLRLLRAQAGLPTLDETSIPGWSAIDELRLLANTVKHGDGRSAQDLRRLRPDLFVSPIAKAMRMPIPRPALPRPVVHPLWGEDLFVQLSDIEAYRDAIYTFWEHARSMS